MKSEVVIRLIQNILKKKVVIEPSDKISALGLSSMQIVQLAVSLEEVCKCDITPAVMAKITTVEDLVNLID